MAAADVESAWIDAKLVFPDLMSWNKTLLLLPCRGWAAANGDPGPRGALRCGAGCSDLGEAPQGAGPEVGDLMLEPSKLSAACGNHQQVAAYLLIRCKF